MTTTPPKRFQPLPAERPAEAEAQVAAGWKAARIFEKSLERTRGGRPFVFYEGPPTANGMPHHGHVLTRVIKDLFPRYKTMLGFHVERKAGWDTHGLPVEIEVEKLLGLEGKQDIEKFGIAPFVQKCRESVWKYQGEWERLTERIGFWIDMGAPYITYSRDYVESVWWALKRIHDAGLLYKGHKILPWCPRDMTGLSSHEVGQGYLEVEDPALTVAFELKDGPGAALGGPGAHALAWTTTPWTLLSNVALVVGPEIDYVFARRLGSDGPGDERTYLLAQARLKAVLGDKVEVLRTVKGTDLVGTSYAPLFDYHGALDAPAHRVVADAFVTTGDGTGIVHAAPAFGEDDQRACRSAGLAFVNLVEPTGRFTAACGPYAGRWVKEADGDIARDLKRRGLLLKQERYKHEYPHCWRCKTPLLYYAREAWFIETTKLKDRLVALNQEIGWFPEHIRDGRFGDFLANNKDWALSRERYWGTPLPVWECAQAGCPGRVVVDSVAALRALNPDVPADLDPHRPQVDEVTVPCPACGGPARRVKEVIDCWFDSGAMPFAQWGTPHVEGSQARFETNHPADFICEAIDQTRGWFYTLHAISTLLFDRPAYRRCLVLGHVLDAQGKKLSKKDKNYKSPDEVLDAHGADAMRWFFLSRMSPGQGVRFYDEAVREARGKFLLKLLNVYKFFQEYASSDGFDPRPGGTPRPAPREREALDRWVLSYLHTTTGKVRAALDAYEFNQAATALEEFVDGLSNWYVRRSRDRGWRQATADDQGKWAFWWTLHEVQTTLARLIAPFVPFLADDLHRVLEREVLDGAAESVHLEAYPEPLAALRDEALEARVALARRVVNLGLAARTSAKANVRRPLRQAVVLLSSPSDEDEVRALADVIADELNVKEVAVSREHDRYVSFDVRVNFPRLGPRLGKKLNAVKKALGELPPAELARAAREGRQVTVPLPDGTSEELLADDLDVRLSAREGFTAAEERGVVVVLDTHADEALVAEGLAREVQSRVQALRKELDLPFDAKVEVTIDGATGALAGAIERHGAAIARETQARSLTLGAVAREGAALVLAPLDPGELATRRARPLVDAVGDALAAARAAAPPAAEGDEDAPFRAVLAGLTAPQQAALRGLRERISQKAGRYEAEFAPASERFVKAGAVEVVVDGQAVARAQTDALRAAAREGVAQSFEALGAPAKGDVLLVGLNPELRSDVLAAWADALPGARVLERAERDGATFLRAAPLDEWTLVVGLRVVA
ncbi:MAG: isoleucine--tRNA ligase [Planctomycetes bacterium]|nr:isoleucine--tRNA ligase [Planctomycetota bacterium]